MITPKVTGAKFDLTALGTGAHCVRAGHNRQGRASIMACPNAMCPCAQGR